MRFFQRRRSEGPESAEQQGAVEIMRVSSTSDPCKVASAITMVLREQGRTELQTIGAGALNQAVKALAIARGYLAPSGIDVICRPAFADVQVQGQDRTAIRLIIESRSI